MLGLEKQLSDLHRLTQESKMAQTRHFTTPNQHQKAAQTGSFFPQMQQESLRHQASLTPSWTQWADTIPIPANNSDQGKCSPPLLGLHFLSRLQIPTHVIKQHRIKYMHTYTQAHTYTHISEHSENLNRIGGLYQCQHSGCDIVRLFRKMLPLGGTE